MRFQLGLMDNQLRVLHRFYWVKMDYQFHWRLKFLKLNQNRLLSERKHHHHLNLNLICHQKVPKCHLLKIVSFLCVDGWFDESYLNENRFESDSPPPPQPEVPEVPEGEAPKEGEAPPAEG